VQRKGDHEGGGRIVKEELNGEQSLSLLLRKIQLPLHKGAFKGVNYEI